MPNYRRIADKQDHRVHASTGWRIETNSGALKGRKGDLKDLDLLVETKTKVSDSGSMKVLVDWFDKIKEQAFSMGKSFGILVLSFGGADDYAAMTRSVWESIVPRDSATLGLKIEPSAENNKKHRRSMILHKEYFNKLMIRLRESEGSTLGFLSFDFNSPISYVAMPLQQFVDVYEEYKNRQYGGTLNADTRDFNECDG